MGQPIPCLAFSLSGIFLLGGIGRDSMEEYDSDSYEGSGLDRYEGSGLQVFQISEFLDSLGEVN